MNGRHKLYRRILVATVAVAMLDSIVYLLVLVAGGADLLQVHRRSVTVHHSEPWLIVALVAGALMTIAWVLADRSLSTISRLARSERAAREAAEELRRRLLISEDERARLEHEHDEERAARENMAA